MFMGRNSLRKKKLNLQQSLNSFENLEPRRLLVGDLIGHWVADENVSTAEDGTIANWTDVVGNHSAVVEGSPSWLTNELGGRAVMQFDPSDGVDGFRVPALSNPLANANDFSVAAVIRTSSTNLVTGTGDWFRNTGLIDSSALGFSTDWGVSINATGQISTGMGGGFGKPVNTLDSTQSGVNDGDRHVIVATRSGTTMSLFIDGEPAGTADGFDASPRSPLDLTFGMLTSGGNGFEGQIAQVRLYDGALDAGEVATLKTEIDAYYSNSAPVAQDDTYDLREDDALFFVTPPQGVLANDSDADNDSLTAVLVAAPENGELVFNIDGSFVYNPAPNYNGVDSFTYTANDFRPGNVATVTLNIESVYDQPQPARDEYKTVPNGTLSIPALVGILSNDSNVDNAPMTAVLDQDVSNGTLELQGDGSFVYSPGAFSGTATFTYRIDDGMSLSTPGTVSIIVNTVPEPNADSYSVNEDAVLDVAADNGILANDVDADGNGLTLTLQSEPTNGVLEMNADGAFRYTPNENYFGADQFSYSVTDGIDASETVSVTIDVVSVNDPPVTAGDAFVAESSRLSVAASRGVLANDRDIDSAALTAQIEDTTQSGSLTLESDGSFVYEPEFGFTGSDRFTYRASDGEVTSDPVEVLIVVQPSTVNIADPTGDSVVTINELMYNPPRLGARLEWIELHNQMGINMDISGWSLTDGIYYEFPEGTVIPGNEYLVVAIDPESFLEATGVQGALGPYTGRLSNGGETVILRNNSDRIMDIINYNDEGDWPVAPDGSGASLAKSGLHLATGDAGNWTFSALVGGTPGAENFPDVDFTPVPTTLIDWDSTASYDDLGVDLGDTWRQVDFDDAAWKTGSGIFEAGDAQFPPAEVGGPAEPGEGLYGYWPLDAGDGDIAENLVEGQEDAIFPGGSPNPRWMEDRRGQVLDFDGRRDTLTLGTLPPIAVNDDFTWSVWFNQASVRNENGVIFGNRSGGQADPLQFIKFTPNNFEYYSGSGDPIIPFSIVDNEWSHLAVVKTGPDLTYYVNGEAVGSGQTTQDQAANPLFLGGDPDAGEYADGLIDDVAVWTRALPEIAVQGLANGEFSPLTAPTTVKDGPIIPPGLPDTRVPISADVTTTYYRYEFDFAESADRTELQLNALIDDGAVFYLNGEEIYRHNLPDGAIDATTPATGENVAIGSTGTISVPSDSLNLGNNVLAVELHQNAGGANDALFSVQLVGLVTPEDPATIFLPILNEITAGDQDTAQVELFNPTDQTIDLTGFQLGNHTFESGTMEPGSYLVVSDAEVGALSEGDELFLFSPGGRRVADAQKVADRLIGRDDSNNGDWYFPTTPTLGSANVFEVNQDIVINEIMYHAPGIYVSELDRVFDNDEEWIELFNRSETETVDLSGWEFSDGIDYVFPAGTTLAPNEYLVISDNPTKLLRDREGLDASHVVGPFARNLSNGGEQVTLVDANGNVVDDLHYYEGGNHWTSLADARGGSLELRDPFADNSIGEAWAASDESHQTAWQTVSITGSGRSLTTGDPRQYHEFLFGMLDAGVALIDDVSVIEHPGTPEARQLIQNGQFESDALGSSPDKWRIIGNQRGSIVADPDDPNNHVLRLDASGPTEHMHNNAGTTVKAGDEFVDLENNSIYEVSFRARYVSGSNQLNSRLYFNRLGTTTRLDYPTQVGTPGAVNSQRVDNIGPTFSGLLHSPAVPEANEPITVSVDASDPHGVSTINLMYAVNGGEFTSTPMTLADGQYVGSIPGQASASLVQFYVEAQDSNGAVAMMPAAGPQSRALIRVQDGNAVDGPRHTLRIVMTDADTELLHRRTNVMSNQRIGGTVIYRENEIYYDVGVRLKGSQRGRDRVVRASFNVGFSPDQLFRDVHSTIAIDRSGSGDEYSQEEIIVRQIINHAGSGPQIYDDLIHVIAPQDRHTGSAMLNLARYNDIFLDSQFVNGSAGTAFEYELIYYPTSLSDSNDPESLKNPNPDSVAGVPLRNLGDSKEAYRAHWIIENNRRQDDYTRIIEALDVLGMRSSDDGFFDLLPQVVDVDQWLRSFAVTTLTGVGDNYTSGAQHNAIFYVRPSDNRLLYLPHDMDFSFTQGPTGGLETNGELRKFTDDPGYEHAYYGHILDVLTTTVNAEYMNEWIDHFDDLVPGQPHFQSFKSWIDRRHSNGLDRIADAVEVVPYEITTAGPLDVGSSSTAVVAGTGWVDVREIRLAGSEFPLHLTWVTNNQWEATVPLNTGTEDVVLEAYDLQGDLVGSQTINITTTGSSTLRDSLRITEINYNPADSGDGELFIDNDQYEWIELRNTGAEAIDLDGVRLVQVKREGELEGIRFNFDAQMLQPGATVVVAKNRDAFISRYGQAHALAEGLGDAGQFGVFSGQLSNGGEVISLLDPNNAVIQQFTYDDGWYGVTDGDGFTLEFVDPSNPDLSAWNDEDNWQASGPNNGTPGAGVAVIGDANLDGVFNDDDLLLIFQAGKYEDDIENNSTWAEGDWNNDGDFTSKDLVAAFIANTFVMADPPAAMPLKISAAAIESIFAGDDDDLAKQDSELDRFGLEF